MSVLDLSVPSVPASQPQIGFFFAGAIIFQYRVACHWLHSPTDHTLQAGRGKCHMDLGGGMYPI